MNKAVLEKHIIEKLCIIGLLLVAKWMSTQADFRIYLYFLSLHIHVHSTSAHARTREITPWDIMLIFLQLILKHLKYSR